MDERRNENLRNSFLPTVLAIVRRCNRVIAESRFGRTANYLGGNDNISILLVYPDRLPDCVLKRAALLGGWTKLGEE